MTKNAEKRIEGTCTINGVEGGLEDNVEDEKDAVGVDRSNEGVLFRVEVVVCDLVESNYGDNHGGLRDSILGVDVQGIESVR